MKFSVLHWGITLFVLSLITACQSANHSEQTTDSTQTVVSSSPSTDSLSIKLLVLKDQFPTAQTIVVADDPVFHTRKTYRAIPLRKILDNFLPKYKQLDSTQTQIIFECEDGYNPSMSLQKVLAKNAYLAISDADAPLGQEWINPRKEGREMKIAPFYVVYTDVPASDVTYKWPYNLVKISLSATDKTLAALFPKNDDTMVKGFELFKTNCLTCHALNQIGGKMGPELNAPRSVTEYWKDLETLKAFVKAPASFRHDCKMPAVTHLSDLELNAIFDYLQYMAKHKTNNQRK